MTTTPLRTVTTTLTRTVDGDTQHHALSLDLNLRLARINCPELATAAGQAAKIWASEWYAAHAGPYTVTIHGLDNWGRYIAEVAAADGHNLSDDLLAAGQAVPYKLTAQLATAEPDAELQQRRAAGYAAQAEAIDRTEHANLNRHHLRPTEETL